MANFNLFTFSGFVGLYLKLYIAELLKPTPQNPSPIPGNDADTLDRSPANANLTKISSSL